jgi:hypothetical protein
MANSNFHDNIESELYHPPENLRRFPARGKNYPAFFKKIFSALIKVCPPSLLKLKHEKPVEPEKQSEKKS